MPEELVRACSNKHGRQFPKFVLFFRDGVSEPQYNSVRREEVDTIRRVFKDLHADPPQITAIVVAKRHHTRFYENPPQAARTKRNGDLIDDGSTNTPSSQCNISNDVLPLIEDCC